MDSHINYKNCKVHFTQKGKGRAVVLLHGFLENLNIWNDISEVLSKHYRVVCIDLLGHGQTDNLGYIHTMEEQAELVKAVLNHLRLRKYVLIGHSMGGYISLTFADLFPNHVVGLCLLNSSALPDSEAKKADRTRAIGVVKDNAPLFVKAAIPNLFAEANRPTFTKDIEKLLKEALKISKQGIIAALEGMKIRKNLSYLLDDTSFKKLIFIGAEDKAINTKELIADLKNHADAIQIVHLSGGHMGFIENKDLVISQLNNFCRLSFK